MHKQLKTSKLDLINKLKDSFFKRNTIFNRNFKLNQIGHLTKQ
jgi:hypothetical protein